MKSYKEMSESVLKAVNEHNVRKNTRNEILKKAIPLCCMCAALAVGVIFWSNRGNFAAVSNENTTVNNQNIPPQNGAEEPDDSSGNAASNVYDLTPDDAAKTDSDPSSTRTDASEKRLVWRCLKYEDGAWYFELTSVSSDAEASVIVMESEKEKIQSALNDMTEYEKDIWNTITEYYISYVKDATSHTTSEGFASSNIFNADSVDSLYTQLQERDLEDGIRYVFYKNEEDFRDGNAMTSGAFEEGVIMKEYTVLQWNANTAPKASDVPWIIAEQLQYSKTVRRLNDNISFLVSGSDVTGIYVFGDDGVLRELNDEDSIEGIKCIIVGYTYENKQYLESFKTSVGEPVWYVPAGSINETQIKRDFSTAD